MSYSHYDRLTALDSMFLDIEGPDVHMHVGAVQIFEPGPLRLPDGGLDIERIFAAIESALPNTKRFRQKLAYIPLFNHPVWVDDDRFNLHYHVRHTSLPHPGSLRLLKRLAGRIMSQQLDRGKPLWEMWIIEGLEDGRFAIVTKAHHCMVDGVSGVEIITALMTPDQQAGQVPTKPWRPRPTPGVTDLLRGEVARYAAEPLSLFSAAKEALSNPTKAVNTLREAAQSLAETIGAGLVPASPTPLNVEIGPHRRFDWTSVELDDIRKIRKRFGGTVNDVVLATVSGAIRRYLENRGIDVDSLNFRSMVPVNVRTQAQSGALGNRVSFLMAHLPVEEWDPLTRLQRVIQITTELKNSRQVRGTELLEEISDRTFTSVFVEFARLATAARAYNLVVTNVPGPQFPVYLLGARMEEIHPLVPLFTNQGLGIALFSYDGTIFWGFNSCWDALPDLHDLVEAVDAEFATLRRLAGDTTAEDSAPEPVQISTARRSVATKARRKVVSG